MRDFQKTRRIVIKVGTNVLTRDSRVDTSVMAQIAREISTLVQTGRQVILVTSGAIGMGAMTLGIETKVREVQKRQALAAVGQGILMHQYQQAFAKYDQIVAQVLLTNRIMSYRTSYVNLKNAMETLLAMNIVPIVNENDCVSIAEIDLAFGDNDRLSALVASKIDAELLIILTDVAGLYDSNPKTNKHAKLIDVVTAITPEIEASAGKAGSTFSTGGMASKIAAIKIAAQAGCKVILASGFDKNVITRVIAGETVGTLFLPRQRLSNRLRWILNSAPVGRIDVDAGAADALRKNRRSLLPVGVTKVSGQFKAGDVVAIGDFARGVCAVDAASLRDMITQKHDHPAAVKKQKAVVHANNLVLLP